MSSRLPSRTLMFAALAWQCLAGLFASRGANRPIRRVLIAHHLLLGDTLMLTALIAKLRERYPVAEIVMTCPKPFATLYAQRPYDLTVVPYDPKEVATFIALWHMRGFNLAIIPADNRYSWLARALGSQHVVAFGDDVPKYKNWLVDDARKYPSQAMAYGDIAALLVDGPPPRRFKSDDWPAPPHAPYAAPPQPYCVLHLGASTPLKFWPQENWRALALWLRQQGCEVVWSAGARETDLVRAVDPQGEFPSLAGQLDIAQLWQLLANSLLLVCPDTGVAHLGRITNTPTVALFGPGSSIICGAGDFWRDSPYRAVSIDIACRDQARYFRRPVLWLRRCGRTYPAQCDRPRCMEGVTLEAVQENIQALLPALRATA